MEKTHLENGKIIMSDKSEPETETENEKYNLPCSYNSDIKCVQYPIDENTDDTACEDCPMKKVTA